MYNYGEFSTPPGLYILSVEVCGGADDFVECRLVGTMIIVVAGRGLRELFMRAGVRLEAIL